MVGPATGVGVKNRVAPESLGSGTTPGWVRPEDTGGQAGTSLPRPIDTTPTLSRDCEFGTAGSSLAGQR
ncbi:hypothetical protein [Haloarcula halophila]|uniref:hypothetical protein n=1 Tax=Haloarcula TaxID=2237 RepID=UPI0023E35FAB|nr:hypothetical protein [Halomicroarcula sp. DFY41]